MNKIEYAAVPGKLYLEYLDYIVYTSKNENRRASHIFIHFHINILIVILLFSLDNIIFTGGYAL